MGQSMLPVSGGGTPVLRGTFGAVSSNTISLSVDFEPKEIHIYAVKQPSSSYGIHHLIWNSNGKQFVLSGYSNIYDSVSGYSPITITYSDGILTVAVGSNYSNGGFTQNTYYYTIIGE